jgi:hydroxymethylbilane synthase
LNPTIRIGTRGSALALAQAHWVREQLQRLHPGSAVALLTIKTAGDRFVDQPLAQLGGKGLFVKEIEEALLANDIDCAVHSMKDLPAEIAAGLTLAAVPPRADPRDVLVTRTRATLEELPSGARVGTTSLRRAALLLHFRPDLHIQPLRGNVDTRLRRLDGGELDAVVLAAAGLQRLGIRRDEVSCFDPQRFVPAVGQGALAIESRAGDARLHLAALDDPPTRAAVVAERAFMQAVGGSCHTPLAAHATSARGRIEMHALIASPDGTRVLRGRRTGDGADAAVLGAALAEELLGAGGAAILAALGDDRAPSPPSPAHGPGNER